MRSRDSSESTSNLRVITEVRKDKAKQEEDTTNAHGFTHAPTLMKDLRQLDAVSCHRSTKLRRESTRPRRGDEHRRPSGGTSSTSSSSNVPTWLSGSR